MHIQELKQWWIYWGVILISHEWTRDNKKQKEPKSRTISLMQLQHIWKIQFISCHKYSKYIAGYLQFLEAIYSDAMHHVLQMHCPHPPMNTSIHQLMGSWTTYLSLIEALCQLGYPPLQKHNNYMLKQSWNYKDVTNEMPRNVTNLTSAMLFRVNYHVIGYSFLLNIMSSTPF